MRAYVVLDIEDGQRAQVLKTLRRRPRVQQVDLVDGSLSVIAVLEGADASALAGTIFTDIKRMSGVKRVTVYPVVPEEELKGLLEAEHPSKGAPPHHG